MLTAGTSAIDDVDGLPATFTYQWVRIAPDSTETDLGTNSTYTVSSLDVDSTIRVDVSFTDLAGNSEGPLPSEATGGSAGGGPMSRRQRLVRDHDRGDTRILWDIPMDSQKESSTDSLTRRRLTTARSFEVEQIYILEPDRL